MGAVHEVTREHPHLRAHLWEEARAPRVPGQLWTAGWKEWKWRVAPAFKDRVQEGIGDWGLGTQEYQRGRTWGSPGLWPPALHPAGASHSIPSSPASLLARGQGPARLIPAVQAQTPPSQGASLMAALTPSPEDTPHLLPVQATSPSCVFISPVPPSLCLFPLVRRLTLRGSPQLTPFWGPELLARVPPGGRVSAQQRPGCGDPACLKWSSTLPALLCSRVPPQAGTPAPTAHLSSETLNQDPRLPRWRPSPSQPPFQHSPASCL